MNTMNKYEESLKSTHNKDGPLPSKNSFQIGQLVYRIYRKEKGLYLIVDLSKECKKNPQACHVLSQTTGKKEWIYAAYFQPAGVSDE